MQSQRDFVNIEGLNIPPFKVGVHPRFDIMETKKAIFHLLPRPTTKHWSSWILLDRFRDLELILRDKNIKFWEGVEEMTRMKWGDYR